MPARHQAFLFGARRPSALHHRCRGIGSQLQFIALLLNDASRLHGIDAAARDLIAQPAEAPYVVIFPSHHACQYRFGDTDAGRQNRLSALLSLRLFFRQQAYPFGVISEAFG